MTAETCNLVLVEVDLWNTLKPVKCYSSLRKTLICVFSRFIIYSLITHRGLTLQSFTDISGDAYDFYIPLFRIRINSCFGQGDKNQTF